ncbi:hypothetical protein BCR33DRAFT_352088 [Rhizoclosmatium globosum]|uniref:MIT domain-containing protein n=1 Tax=Rhizoclosmatium globosum TaxID=329046 RepID=A0A1Y2C413_9FUNG|nr:hypothetical protein BCR33DRAFT_352088 [Rhizoclosmatium globosum]|eukprot:ORY41045.1 hypothetical protein BCR33DRAFT_352088 [Rhizoclosmatium globosum]
MFNHLSFSQPRIKRASYLLVNTVALQNNLILILLLLLLRLERVFDSFDGTFAGTKNGTFCLELFGKHGLNLSCFFEVSSLSKMDPTTQLQRHESARQLAVSAANADREAKYDRAYELYYRLTEVLMDIAMEGPRREGCCTCKSN